MSYTCSFVDEVLYGPEDVNEVVGDLVGAGLAPFISKDSYNPSDLNSLTAEVVSSGVQLNGCKVSRVSETVVSVAPGIIYFGNGMRLKVTEEHLITVPVSTALTIYARYIPSEGTGELTYSTLTITKSDYNISLATISTTGTITDVREFAESKVTTLGTNVVYNIPSNKVTVYDYNQAPSYGDLKVLCKVNLSGVNINRFNCFGFSYWDSSAEYNRVSLWDFKNEETYQPFIYNTCHITRNFSEFIFTWNRDSDYGYRYPYNFVNAGKDSMKLI